ncbi:MAG TPA: molybdenum cofactor biosynthesis protein B [Solimonas sp.]|nr:molybdenum cofactor biosynthesis protein B [Solimonas sp.]
MSGLNICVLAISDTRTLQNDASGAVLGARLDAAGHRLHDRQIVRDDIYAIRAVVSRWIVDAGAQVILTTGGTGVTGRDGTPEAIAPLLDKTLEGFGELFRSISFQRIGASTIQSRCLAGVANGRYVFCLPGSVDACETGWDHILKAQLDETTRPCNFATILHRLAER